MAGGAKMADDLYQCPGGQRSIGSLEEGAERDSTCVARSVVLISFCRCDVRCSMANYYNAFGAGSPPLRRGKLACRGIGDPTILNGSVSGTVSMLGVKAPGCNNSGRRYSCREVRHSRGGTHEIRHLG
jgi:hypothetical protein